MILHPAVVTYPLERVPICLDLSEPPDMRWVTAMTLTVAVALANGLVAGRVFVAATTLPVLVALQDKSLLRRRAPVSRPWQEALPCCGCLSHACCCEALLTPQVCDG